MSRTVKSFSKIGPSEYETPRLSYLGYNWSGNGKWHQFALVEKPEQLWCEVQPEDSKSFEETK